MPPKPNGKTKKQKLVEDIAAAVSAGREVSFETVDFSDPNRPKTCLEVDFPILPINQIAAIEGNAGKPIYQMSKWWARRRSSVFRSMLIAAATKAPTDESKAAMQVWQHYYSNYQTRGSFKHLNVADPFMGGGTTVVEGSRLGMQMFGCDLNPVAWLIVKNEVTRIDVEEVKRLIQDVEDEVRPFIMPYFTCDGPSGEKGKWFRRTESSGEWEELSGDFDIFSIPWQQRRSYRYEGPEIIYTFWAKHAPCQREGCGHRTPIMSSPVIATKTLSVDAWYDWECGGCGRRFDVERHAARMAPESPLVVAPDEKPFVVMDAMGHFSCPHCEKKYEDRKAAVDGSSITLGKSKGKKVDLTLLIHPGWLRGCPRTDDSGKDFGGTPTDSLESSTRWFRQRASTVKLLEVRGNLPDQVTCPLTGTTFYTDERGGTVPKRSTFACAIDGTSNDVLASIRATQKTGPKAAYVIQGYSPKRDKSGAPYGGRFFASASNPDRYIEALREWEDRKGKDLANFWPTSEVPYGFMTHMNNGGIPNHGYTHWWKMFNPTQLLVLSQLLRSICENRNASWISKEFLLGAFQQYLRYQNMFVFWQVHRDCMAPHFSNNNYHPKANAVENGVFSDLGSGNWKSCCENALEGIAWAREPWELVVAEAVRGKSPELAEKLSGKSERVYLGDEVITTGEIECRSATDLTNSETGSVDLCITDPPFGGLLHYSELSDFFYVWLRLALKDKYPDCFSEEYVPKALEAVANKARHATDADAFYQKILTECWREAYRMLKAGGILAFTFHHSEDEPWIQVLESLFDAGFYLEAAYPIRSDETKGEGAKPGTFGSQTIEYDIIHVCRKRVADPQPISWARLRRLIVDDVRRIKNLLTQHQNAGLPAADLQVIKRGKALEYFSRHYGKVYIEQGRPFTIREALAGINQLLDDDTGVAGGPEAPPPSAEPFTRQFFRIFYETTQVPRDQIQKFLRSTGISPGDFVERGWCSERSKVFTLTDPTELATKWRGASRKGMARDFDQTMFLVGACFEGSGIRVEDTLNSPNYAPHPATEPLVDWLCRHGGSSEIKMAAQRARTIYRDWLSKNKGKAEEQLKLFDLEG